MTDWDKAFANAAYIPGSAHWPNAWSDAASAYRTAMLSAGHARLDLSYGHSPRQRFDLFLPSGNSCGLLVFVHGGYWLSFDKSSWSHFAQGAVARGFAVAVPSYRLCPDVSIATIATDVSAAIASAAALVQGPIVLAGHSAGGQLVARLAATTTPLAKTIQDRLRRVTAISGLHDLRPLMATTMNATLKIDAAEAASESPASLTPIPGVVVTAWVGANERPEFIRQSDLLGSAWPEVKVHRAASCHHFNVLDPLCDPGSRLNDVVLGSP